MPIGACHISVHEPFRIQGFEFQTQPKYRGTAEMIFWTWFWWWCFCETWQWHV